MGRSCYKGKFAGHVTCHMTHVSHNSMFLSHDLSHDILQAHNIVTCLITWITLLVLHNSYDLSQDTYDVT